MKGRNIPIVSCCVIGEQESKSNITFWSISTAMQSVVIDARFLCTGLRIAGYSTLLTEKTQPKGPTNICIHCFSTYHVSISPTFVRSYDTIKAESLFPKWNTTTAQQPTNNNNVDKKFMQTDGEHNSNANSSSMTNFNIPYNDYNESILTNN